MSDQAPSNKPAPRVSLDDEPAPSGRRSMHVLSRPGHYVNAPVVAPDVGDQAKAARAMRAKLRPETGTSGGE
jgi:hypothetical protein